MSELRCVVVTPEQTELDVTTESVTVPLFDGEMGIMKGHSPLVGRLGYGILRVRSTGESAGYFLDGGFVQVVDNVVSVLTDRMIPMSDVTASSAAEALKAATEMPADKPDLAAVRNKALDRARALTRLAG